MATATLDPATATDEAESAPLQIDVADLDIAHHDATLTLVSPKTGEHRTFRVRTIRERRNPTDCRDRDPLLGRRVVELLIGSNNTADFQPFAFVADDGSGRIFVWKRFRHADGRVSQHERLADLLARPGYWSGRGVEYQVSLQCRRCGRDLTHPESIRDGLGPICREKAMGVGLA